MSADLSDAALDALEQQLRATARYSTFQNNGLAEKTLDWIAADTIHALRDLARMQAERDAEIALLKGQRDSLDGVIAAQRAKVALLQADMVVLRHLLFLSHGSAEHYLYGDDGERSCNTCMIDFNLDSPTLIEQKMSNHALLKLARAALKDAKP